MAGDGRFLRFWLDDWVGVGPLCELFLRVFRLVSNKESVVSDCYEVMDGCIMWGVTFRRSLRLSKDVQYEELLSLLFNVCVCVCVCV